eukprot:tig00000507_g1789.t1
MGSALSNNSQRGRVVTKGPATSTPGESRGAGRTSRSSDGNASEGKQSLGASLSEKAASKSHDYVDLQQRLSHLRLQRSDGTSPAGSANASPAATQTLTQANGLQVPPPKVETLSIPAPPPAEPPATLQPAALDPRLAPPEPPEHFGEEEEEEEAAHDDGYYTEEERRRRRGQSAQRVEAPPQPIRWQRGEMLGAGAFGKVFLGLNVDTGELIAIKQVSYAGINKQKAEEHVAALEVEIALLKQLQHENIVRYVGSETDPEHQEIRIFLEYVPGGSIASLISKFGHLTESVIRVYTRQLLLGLDYLHSHQIMHRDIKGANILVDNTGTIKLADFGASKKLAEIMTISDGHKSLRGTPYWMAPEVIKQTGHGRQADIWSVGCTVLEMATGKPPWSQFQSQVSALFHIASAKGPPPIPEHLSADAHDFLMLCFRRSPKERPNASRLLTHPFVANAETILEDEAAEAEAEAAAAAAAAAAQPPPAPPAPAHPPRPPAALARGRGAAPGRPGGGARGACGERASAGAAGGEILGFLADKVQRDYDSLTDGRFRDGYASILRQHAAERGEGPPAPGSGRRQLSAPRARPQRRLPAPAPRQRLRLRGAPAARRPAAAAAGGAPAPSSGMGESPSGRAGRAGPGPGPGAGGGGRLAVALPEEGDWEREARRRQYVAELDAELQRMRDARRQQQQQQLQQGPPQPQGPAGGDWGGARGRAGEPRRVARGRRLGAPGAAGEGAAWGREGPEAPWRNAPGRPREVDPQYGAY